MQCSFHNEVTYTDIQLISPIMVAPACPRVSKSGPMLVNPVVGTAPRATLRLRKVEHTDSRAHGGLEKGKGRFLHE